MRILFVIPRVRSFTAFLGELSAALLDGGHEVHCACSMSAVSDEPPASPDPRVQFHPVEMPRGLNPAGHLAAARALDRLVQSLRPDLVHAHFSVAIFTTALARRRRSWPVTHATFHGVSFLAMRGARALMMRAAESWSARRFDTVWVLTDCDRDGLAAAASSALGRSVADVRRLPGWGVGCDLARFSPVPPAEREKLRAALGFAPGHVVFAFVGRFVDFKGFALAARAFLRLAPEHPEIRLLLIGSRDPLHPTGLTVDEESALKASAEVIDAGFHEDVSRVLAAADAMVFPSKREGMAVSLMESLALGVPAITCDARGCRDVVRDGVDGIILRERSVEALGGAMRRVTGDAALRAKWGAAALAGRARFDRAAFIAAQTRIYENAIGNIGNERSSFRSTACADTDIATAADTGTGASRCGCALSKRIHVCSSWRGKRAMDFAVALAALFLLAPVLLLVALLVRIKLGSPVLFTQERPGLGGRPFRICKFRTMTDARDAAGEPLPDEVRLTSFGRFLRSTSLDELPELFNILRGEMSLVGPRPLLTQYLDRYSPEQSRRHDVRPGLTGWAQINGRNAQTWERKLALDIWYVDHQSLALDLLILWRTVSAVLARDGISMPEHATAPEFMGSTPEAEQRGVAEAAAMAPGRPAQAAF